MQIGTQGGVALQISAGVGLRHRLEVSPDLRTWTALSTFAGAARHDHLDTAPGGVRAVRFYRIRTLEDGTALTGDHLTSTDGDVVLHPVNHASVVFSWKGVAVYVDPVGGTAPFVGLPKADLILITHGHGDHYNAATVGSGGLSSAPVIVPAAVYAGMASGLRSRAISLANGSGTNLLGLTVDAVPAYNGNHPKGAGNGYVVTLGGRRLYFSGDTGDIPEMRALVGIDAAFVCMNMPFTMTGAQAAAAVRAFRPVVVYPYHFRNSDGSFTDLEAFARLVGGDLGIEVRQREWY